MKINTQHGWSFTVWDDQCPTCHVCGADTVHNALGEIGADVKGFSSAPQFVIRRPLITISLCTACLTVNSLLR